jgi:hypothetical protein
MKLKGQRNQCRGCSLYFNSNLAFDKHRIGQHGVDRRCRTEEEITVAGMALNALGYWVSEKMSESVSAMLGDEDEEGLLDNDESSGSDNTDSSE